MRISAAAGTVLTAWRNVLQLKDVPALQKNLLDKGETLLPERYLLCSLPLDKQVFSRM